MGKRKITILWRPWGGMSSGGFAWAVYHNKKRIKKGFNKYSNRGDATKKRLDYFKKKYPNDQRTYKKVTQWYRFNKTLK